VEVQGKVSRVDPAAKVIVLDDGRVFTLTDRTVILVNGQPTSGAGLAPGTWVVVRDAEPSATGGHAAATSGDLTMTVQAPQPSVTVQVPQSKVIVQQPAPRIVVNQPPPEVTVAPAPAPQVSMAPAPAPEVTVQAPRAAEGAALPRQAQTAPGGQTVTAPAELSVTVQAPQPSVSVQVPQSKVIVQQPAPRIIVNQPPPEVTVAPAPAPEVIVERQAAAAPAASPALQAAPPAAAPPAVVPAPRAVVVREPWCAGDWEANRGTNFGTCPSLP
jgi:hypothetical protein